MATYYWFCKKCHIIEKLEGRIQDKPPAEYNGCKHDWKSHNPKTASEYQCRKCGITVWSSNSIPTGGKCGRAGSSHSFVKLPKR